GLSNPNISNPTAQPAATTTYTVTVSGPDICPVQNTDEITVTVNEKPFITTGGNVVSCGSEPVQIWAAAPGATSYAWTPAATLSDPSISNPLANPVVSTTYTVQVTHANLCSNTATVTVKKGEIDGGSVCPTQTICLGNSVQLSAAGGLSYTWSPATGLSCTTCPNPIASPSGTTTYEVNITTLNGCVSKKTVTVIVNPALNVTVNSAVNTCVGETVVLQAQGAKEYLWSPSDELSCEKCASPSFTASVTKNYTVTGFDGNCKDTASVKVTVDPAQDADFTAGASNCAVTFTAFPSGMTKYEWDLGDGTTREGQTFEHNYSRSGLFKVTLTVTGDCGTVNRYHFVKMTDCNNACN
ncbi:MAG TPA: PKD domain-containing protein, partial [Bacteroidia bacterium]|nr:PKD domain-containing protein [Bacteroidia bacterium]